MANNFYISILFDSSSKSYYFSTDDENLKLDDYVVVETTIGKEIGHVVQEPKPIETLKFDFEVKPILRKALPSDMHIYEENKKLALQASALFEENIKSMNLDMRLISSEYTLDRTKILFVYASETRIDFRELLKILAAKLHCRIELKQINARERAQAIGGIGICGLPICCATFFKTFDGISITRAKNQMLTINIPKLSGLCGKLMCCLKYEDDLYTELKQEFPPVGTFVTFEKEKYKVTGFNVLTKIVKIENEENTNFVHLNELMGGKRKGFENLKTKEDTRETEKPGNKPNKKGGDKKPNGPKQNPVKGNAPKQKPEKPVSKPEQKVEEKPQNQKGKKPQHKQKPHHNNPNQKQEKPNNEKVSNNQNKPDQNKKPAPKKHKPNNHKPKQVKPNQDATN